MPIPQPLDSWKICISIRRSTDDHDIWLARASAGWHDDV
jgi:hypothetical protein